MGSTLIALLALAGCSLFSSGPQPPDVILVTLDTTRADRIGCYGYDKAKTESIDALAAKGRRFTRAYSPIPLTIPAHTAIHTGRYPARLGVRGNGDAPVPDSAVTLAELLHDHGYATGASVAAFVTSHAWGFQQGFDTFDDKIPNTEQNLWHAERPGSAVVDDAIAWWNAQDGTKPRFLWVHLYDAHYPYEPPPAYAEAAQGRMYDGELAYVDDQVGRLVDMVGDRDVLWVVSGDHGEGLGDHGELTHGMFVYDATQHVPLVISGHGVPAEVVDQPVSLVDIVPTVMTILGFPVPDGVDGVPIPGTPHPIYMETWELRDRFGLAPHVGVVDGDEKLIDVPRPELYDVVADPDELADKSTADPLRIAALKATLAGFGIAPPKAAAQGVADPDIAAQLASLGYTDGGFTGAVDGPLPDPKDHADLIKLSQRAERLEHEEKYGEAADVYRGLIADHPDINEFRNRLAMALEHEGKRDAAIAVEQDALKQDPTNTVIKSTLAALLGRAGRHDEAAVLYRECADAMPYSARLRSGALMAMLAAGHVDEAVELGNQYLGQYPDDDAVAGLIGLGLMRQGSPQDAEPYLKRGLEADVPPINVALRLSEIAAQRGDGPGANAMILREVELHPENDLADRAAIAMLSDAQRWDVLARDGEQMARANPDIPLYWHAWAQARFNLGDYAGCRVVLDKALAKFPSASILVLLDANLLAKEGKRGDGAKRFEEAKALKASEDAAAKAAP